MYKHILLATDGSDLAQKAVDHALALAKALSARVTAVIVTEPLATFAYGEAAIAFPLEDYENRVEAFAAKILSAVSDTAKAAGVPCRTLHERDQFPAEGIIETAEAEECDLIVMASHGRRGLSRLFLGSQANRVVTQSTIPVLICR